MIKRILRYVVAILVGSCAVWASFTIQSAVADSSQPTLWDCFKSKQMAWTFQNRANEAAKYGIWQYRGTADQNTRLRDLVCPKENVFGFSVVTDYQKTLAAPVTASQSTLTVSSLILKDGTYLDITAIGGGKVFLTIEPGASKEEIVMCTGITTTTNQFTGCNRGLAFSGTSTASVTANQRTHNSGSTVVMSNVHYVYEQYVDVNAKDQTIAGNKTATGTWIFTTSTSWGDNTGTESKYFYIRNGDANYPYIRYNELLGSWQFSDDGVTSVTFATSASSGLTASTTKGIFITDSKIGVNASTTRGLDFGTDGYLYVKTSSTVVGISTDSLGNLYFNQDGIFTFSKGLNIPAPIGATSSTNKNYVDFLVSQNMATGTAGTAIVYGNTLAIGATGTIVLADADTTSTLSFIGIAASSGAAGASITYVKPGGILHGAGALTAGSNYYVSGSATLSTSKGTVAARVGRAISSTDFQVIVPSFYQVSSSGLQLTFDGSIRYVTTTWAPDKVTMYAANSGELNSTGQIVKSNDGTERQFAVCATNAGDNWTGSNSQALCTTTAGGTYTVTMDLLPYGFSLTQSAVGGSPVETVRYVAEYFDN